MNCPRDHEALRTEKFKGIDQERCPKCGGVWLDYPELSELESTVLPEEDLRGTLMFSSEQTDLACPKCGQDMQRFDYRLDELPMEFCPKLHGFWLDAGQEQRVLELMKERVQGIKRSQSAEKTWDKEREHDDIPEAQWESMRSREKWSELVPYLRSAQFRATLKHLFWPS